MIKWKLAVQHWQSWKNKGYREGADAISALMIAALPERQRQAHEAIRLHPGMSAADLGRRLKLSNNNAIGLCHQLERLGLVKSKRSPDNRAYYLWEVRS